MQYSFHDKTHDVTRNKTLSKEKFQKLIIHWDNEIKKYNLKWELSPNLSDVDFDPVVFMKKKHNICFTPFEKIQQ